MLDSLDSPQTLFLHQKIIKENLFLHRIYEDFYKEIKKLSNTQKPIVELGSGGGFIKKIIPQTITSDVIKGHEINMVFSASKIPFKKNSVGSFVMLNVFHHLNNPYKALKEMGRCLKIDGKIIMIEPYNSIWSKFIYQKFHHENFNPKAKWNTQKKGRMTSANIALPWIIFVRDRNFFSKEFSYFKIVKFSIHTPFKYLVSGGLSYPQLLPSAFYPFMKLVEKIISPLNQLIGMFATIEIQKIKKI